MWKIKDGSECDLCDRTDTIEHRMFYCIESKQIWKSIQSWTQNVLEIDIEFRISKVIFGIPLNNDPYKHLINYIILVAKWYINKIKEQLKPLYFIQLQSIITNKIESMIFMITLKDREN